MCHRVETGQPITEEALKEYELSKLGRENVNLLYLEEPQLQEMKKFSLSTMAGNFMATIGFKKKEVVDQSAPSIRVAKEKRRGPLFGKVVLGSIEEVDEKLKKVE